MIGQASRNPLVKRPSRSFHTKSLDMRCVCSVVKIVLPDPFFTSFFFAINVAVDKFVFCALGTYLIGLFLFSLFSLFLWP